MSDAAPSAGSLLQGWRRRRRLSQLDLATDVEISQRHLSFIESGRSVPSRDMLLRIAKHLRIPMREQNALLVAAGYAPIFHERPLNGPGLEAARQAVELILKGHEPHPALAIDRHWTLLSQNNSVSILLQGVDPQLLEPPVNVLRLSLHPLGLAPKIRNFREFRAHLVERLIQQIDASGDGTLVAMLEEMKSYPVPPAARPPNPRQGSLAGIAVPFELLAGGETLSFLSTTTVFGSALDITLSELAIETFFPANPETVTVMQRLMAT